MLVNNDGKSIEILKKYFQTCDYLDGLFRESTKTYTFLQLSNVQDVGHLHGYCSDEYLDAVQETDGLVCIHLVEIVVGMSQD